MKRDIAEFVSNNVCRTGSNRPIRPARPSNGHRFSLVRMVKPECDRTGFEPCEPVVQPVNQLNRLVYTEQTGSVTYIFKKINKFKTTSF